MAESESDAPLPVLLISFNIKTNGINHTLHWSVASEPEVLGYLIENKSEHDINYKFLDNYMTNPFLEAKGEGSSTYSYTVPEECISSKPLTYRLSAYGLSGGITILAEKKTMGNTVKISDNGIENIKVYPNPFNTQFIITFSVVEAIVLQVKIYDITGQIHFMQSSRFVQKGVNRIHIDLNKTATGLYILELKSPGMIYHKKIAHLK